MSTQALDTKNTTVDFDEWAKVMADVAINPAPELNSYISVHAGEYLQPLLTGYMTEPVSIYNGHCLTARIVITTDIREFKEELSLWVSKGKKVFLYMPIWFPGHDVFKKLDPETSNYVNCDPPERFEERWKIRLAILED